MDYHVVSLTYECYQFILYFSFYRCHPSEFLMTYEDNIDIFPAHIFNAIAEIRNSKKSLDNKFITEFIQKSHSTKVPYIYDVHTEGGLEICRVFANSIVFKQ